MIQSFNLTHVLLYDRYISKRRQGKWFNFGNLVSGAIQDAAIRMEFQVKHSLTFLLLWLVCTLNADIFWKHHVAPE